MKLESDRFNVFSFWHYRTMHGSKIQQKCNFKEVTIFSSSKAKSQVFVIFLVEKLQSGMRNEE